MSILLEARPYRPFKSSEEYLEAMKEDLAEWLSTMYPELLINAEHFMDRLDTGVALCKHANYVRQAAEDYLARRQARNKSMTRSMTSGLAGPILAMGNVHYLPAAKSGTFFARDNVSNFITWCRKSLKIIECLLFETDDLIMRKNEKHVILCLLEVARRGAKFGMLAPMLVQMERQIDREIAADNKANGIGCGTQTDSATGGSDGTNGRDVACGTNNIATETDMFDTDSENEDEDDDGPMLVYGPQPQIITNDLKSLDEMVRDLVEKCTCPSQFPMVRVSEGKYRIGDTKVLIFVRILRSHVMVRVGGGWDTLSHYLDKHDPCRCRTQHRSSVAARLIPRSSNQANGGIELHKAQVIFERSPPTARKIISSFNSPTAQHHHSPSATSTPSGGVHHSNSLSPNYTGAKTRSRSPTPQRKYLNQLNSGNANNHSVATTTSATTTNSAANFDNNTYTDKYYSTNTQVLSSSPNLARRSMSPSPRRLIDMRKKQPSLESNNGPKSLPNGINVTSNEVAASVNHVQFDSLNLIHRSESSGKLMDPGTPPNGCVSGENSNSNKFENISDNGSEISDEGYRSLGVIQSNAQKRESLHSQTSIDDAESNARLDPTSSDSQLSPVDDRTLSTKTPESLETYCNDVSSIVEQPEEVSEIISTLSPVDTAAINKFEQSGVFITDDEITVDIASATGLRKTDFSAKILGGGDQLDSTVVTDQKSQGQRKDARTPAGKLQPKSIKSKIPRSPVPQRRRSVDNSSCNSQLPELHARTGLPVFNRKKPVYRSVRKPNENVSCGNETETRKLTPVRDVTNTWSGRVPATGKKRPSIGADTFGSPPSSSFDRNSKTRSSQILYDSNGRRIKGCTASLTTSPVKNHAASPLAQQLLEAASSAKNDAQILEKMKTLLSRYSTATTTTSNSAPKANNPKKPIYDDFTTAWVNSNGNLERSSSCSPPTKVLSKRSSAASSNDSTHSRDISGIVSPRRDRGMSKIPGPLRQNTELY